MTKICSKCKQSKQLESYHKKGGTRDGLRNECKECKKQYDIQYQITHQVKYQQYRNSHKEKSKEYQKQYNTRLKNLVFQHYENQCTGCRIKDTRLLQIDHINNDGAEHRRQLSPKTRGSSGAYFYLWIIKNNFPTNLQLLCANCHFLKTQGFFP